MDLSRAAHEIEHDRRIDTAVDALREVAGALPGDAREKLQGKGWLGHAVHPALTDLPIGFWTSAAVLDVIGGKRAAPMATAMVGLGIVSVVPTAASGFADWSDMSRAKQRVGVVHMAANTTATLLYALSYKARRSGKRGRGILLGMAGMGVATAGGYLGGHLAFGEEDPAAHERSGDQQVLALDGEATSAAAGSSGVAAPTVGAHGFAAR